MAQGKPKHTMFLALLTVSNMRSVSPELSSGFRVEDCKC